MSYLPPEPKDPRKPTNARLALWIAGAAIGVYFIIQGIIGIVQHG